MLGDETACHFTFKLYIFKYGITTGFFFSRDNSIFLSHPSRQDPHLLPEKNTQLLSGSGNSTGQSLGILDKELQREEQTLSYCLKPQKIQKICSLSQLASHSKTFHLEKETRIRMNIFQVYLLVLRRKKYKIQNYDLKSNLALDQKCQRQQTKK